MTAAVTVPWIETQATVTTCRFQFAGLGNLAWGFSTRERFRITFDYYAQSRLYSGEFQSPVAVPQNETIPISYNPLNPQENSRDRDSGSAVTPGGKPPILAVGIAGSILLSLLWLAILRGCR
jgi:hypothetical protein